MHRHQSDSYSSDESMDLPPSFKRDAHDLRIELLGVSGAGKRNKEQKRERQEYERSNAMKEGASHAVSEPENVQQRKNASQEKQKQDKSGKVSQEKQQTIEEKHPTKAGGSRWLAVCLGIICVLLLVIIILLIIVTEQSYSDPCQECTKRIVMSDLRIMMVGKTGAGKSASGNTILGEKVFAEKMSSESVTMTCQEHRRKVKGGSISVTDTPGLFNTEDNKEQLKDEIEKCVNMSVPGPHVFLLVIRLDMTFTNEEKKTVKWIQENFGEKAADYFIILFTRGDQIDEPIEEFLKGNRQIEELVRQCKSRYHVFNNKDNNPSQVNELLDKIVSMVMENGGGHYTNEMYKEALKKQKGR